MHEGQVLDVYVGGAGAGLSAEEAAKEVTMAAEMAGVRVVLEVAAAEAHRGSRYPTRKVSRNTLYWLAAAAGTALQTTAAATAVLAEATAGSVDRAVTGNARRCIFYKGARRTI